MNNFLESLNELNETLSDVREPQKLTQGAALQMQDHYQLARKYLTHLAQERLSKKSNTQVIQEPGSMKCFMSAYLSTRVRNDGIEKGVKALSEVLNVLAEKGYIHSCLAPLSSLKLAEMPMEHPTSMVICFPLVPADKMDEVKAIAKDFMTCEGGIGHTLDSVEKELPNGQFFAQVHISHSMTMFPQKMSVEEKLEEHIQDYLKVLPKGTTVVSTRPCAIIGLSLPFEVIFHNRLLNDYKEVKLIHVRHCTVINDHLEQFNLIQGVDYVKRDGQVSSLSR